MNTHVAVPFLDGARVLPVAPSSDLLFGPMIPRLVQVGDLVLDMLRQTVRKGDQRLIISRRQFQVLLYLSAYLGTERRVTQVELEKWMYGREQIIKSHAMSEFIYRLRIELKRSGSQVKIEIKWNEGYRLVAKAADCAM